MLHVYLIYFDIFSNPILGLLSTHVSNVVLIRQMDEGRLAVTTNRKFAVDVEERSSGLVNKYNKTDRASRAAQLDQILFLSVQSQNRVVDDIDTHP